MNLIQDHPMNYRCVRLLTDGQNVAAPVAQIRAVGCAQLFRGTASGAKTDRVQLRKALTQLDADKARFRSFGNTWTDTTISRPVA